jgi:hypothetical protein
MRGAMVRALDPYHRIRATVAAVFVLMVCAMALLTMHGPRHRAVSSTPTAASVGAPAPSAGPAAHHARRAH